MITNDLQNHQAKIDSYITSYKRVLSDSLNANLLPYLIKVEEQFSADLKKSLGNKRDWRKKSGEVIINIHSTMSSLQYINFFYQNGNLVGILGVDNVIEDYLYKQSFFTKKQIKCTYVNYRNLLKESENIDPSLLEDPKILEQVLTESPTLVEDVKRYYENNGFKVKISPSNIRAISLNW